MEAIRLFKLLNRDQRNTFVACFLGWALDALDFFLVTFVLVPIGHDFGRSIPKVAFAITLTLMMRPVGALIFGWLGDKFGRRIPLMADIIFYSVMELLTAFAPNFTVFLILRALFGIGMGGEWGLGASLAMESLPTQARGLFSGILQQGYAVGYLLAALVYWIVFPHFGWRGLFIAGAVPAFLVIYIRARVPESPVWQRQRAQQKPRVKMSIFIRQHGALFIYAALLMTAFNYMSHGTQDLYPTYLEKQRGFGVSAKSMISIVYATGAICGGAVMGFLSQQWGRRRVIIISAAFGMLLIPLWIFAPSTALLIMGGFLIQFMVQGAWGVVPVHLNELSPPEFRGTFPGLAYQLGNFAAAYAAQQQAWLAEHFRSANGEPNYALTMAVVEAVVFLVIIFLAAIGREERLACMTPIISQPRRLPPQKNFNRVSATKARGPDLRLAVARLPFSKCDKRRRRNAVRRLLPRSGRPALRDSQSLALRRPRIDCSENHTRPAPPDISPAARRESWLCELRGWPNEEWSSALIGSDAPGRMNSRNDNTFRNRECRAAVNR
jgi:SHS family lactate transporter-like MFS transporter